MYTDTNKDGVADKRELFTTDFGRSANVEHQEAELTWLMDNWMYATRNAVRLRWTPKGAIREPIGNPGGSWGITQDDDGKMFSQGGASGVPGYFQFPVHYGEFAHPNELEQGMRTPYGAAVKIADMQGGMDSVRMPDGSLNGTTAGAGGDIFRGHRLPAELLGDYFYGEVVARIVRRMDVRKNEGLTQLANVYQSQQTEFIKTTDPLFRPVGTADGARRDDVHRRHVPRHHPGRAVDAAGLVPPRENRAVSARQGHRPRPHLAAVAREHAARRGAAEDVRRDARRSSFATSRTRTAGGATRRSRNW